MFTNEIFVMSPEPALVLFRRDARTGWLRAEAREREADVVVCYELCTDHPPKGYY